MFSKHWDKVNDDDKVESTSFFFFSIWLFIFDQEMSSRSKKKLDLSRTHMGSLNCCFEIFSYEFNCMINFNWFFDVSFYVISRAAALVYANKREKKGGSARFSIVESTMMHTWWKKSICEYELVNKLLNCDIHHLNH